MADKQTFYESINTDSIFDEEFYKKVYGYSIYDNQFIPRIAGMLIQINRKDIIAEYNQWFITYKAKSDEELKEVAKWYSKQTDNKYENWLRNNNQKVVVKWQPSELLQKKKELLLKKKLLLLSER